MEESQADLALSLKDHLEKLALRLDLARSERALAWRALRLDCEESRLAAVRSDHLGPRQSEWRHWYTTEALGSKQAVLRPRIDRNSLRGNIWIP